MYNLKRVSETEWSIGRDKQTPFVGNLKDVCHIAMIAFGFKMEELEMAVDEIAWMDHDTAHFGIKRRFIYTYDTKREAA